MEDLNGLAVAGIIDSLISFAIIGLIVLLVGTVLMGIIAVWIALSIQRRVATRWLRSASNQVQSITSRLSSAIVSDTFKDLELGFKQGESQRIVSDLQQAVLSMHQQADKLQKKVEAERVPFLAIVLPLYRCYKLKREVRYFAHQVEPVLRDLDSYESQDKHMRQRSRQAKARLQEISEILQKASDSNGSATQKLHQKLIEVKEAAAQADQLTAFDTHKSREAWDNVFRSLDALQVSMRNAYKN